MKRDGKGELNSGEKKRRDVHCSFSPQDAIDEPERSNRTTESY
jgi:hypothetical protein